MNPSILTVTAGTFSVLVSSSSGSRFRQVTTFLYLAYNVVIVKCQKSSENQGTVCVHMPFVHKDYFAATEGNSTNSLLKISCIIGAKQNAKPD